MCHILKSVFKDYLIITIGSLLYAFGTVVFIFPSSLLLGGTSGISVILDAFLPYSPGSILVFINFVLTVLAFIILGRNMAVRTFVGSTLTSVFIGTLEAFFNFTQPLIPNLLISAVLGAMIIAFAGGILFYVDASSGGTDILALIVKKYSDMNIGRALLFTDFIIVIVGAFLSGYKIGICSLIGLLIKTFGIDFVISFIKKNSKKKSVF